MEMVFFANVSVGDTKLPRQMEPKDDVSDNPKFSRNTELQHVCRLSGSVHQDAITPATVTWIMFYILQCERMDWIETNKQ